MRPTVGSIVALLSFFKISSVYSKESVFIFLVIYVLGLAVSPEEGSNFLPKLVVLRSVLSLQ